MSDLDGYFLKVPLAIIPEPPTDDGEDDDETDEGDGTEDGDGTGDGDGTDDGTDGTDGDGTDGDGTDGDGTNDGTDDGTNDGGDTDPENPDEPTDPPTDPPTDGTTRRRLQTNETTEPDIPVKTSLFDSYQWFLVELKQGQLFVWSNESSPIFNSTDYDLT